MNNYEAWQLRVIEERDELATKMVALNKFLSSDAGNNLNPQHRTLLKTQALFMEGYLNTLCERIALFDFRVTP